MDVHPFLSLLSAKGKEAYDTGVIALGNLIRIAFSSLPESKMEKFVENLVNACK